MDTNTTTTTAALRTGVPATVSSLAVPMYDAPTSAVSMVPSSAWPVGVVFAGHVSAVAIDRDARPAIVGTAKQARPPRGGFR